jgi:CheY-like chemotaxis protein
MKILFLDDSKERHDLTYEWFAPRCDPKAGSQIVRAYSAAEAIGLYLLHQNSYEPFDLVSLDHDLGDQFDGMDVVDNILTLHDQLDLPTPRFEVHSWNLPAAERMSFKLGQAGFQVTQKPFSPEAYLNAP